MSETVVLSGEGDLTPNQQAARIIRYERSRDPSLSRFEHDILAGYEAALEGDHDMLYGDESLGFALTTAAVGIVGNALAKGKALNKVAGLFKKVRDKIKGKIDKVKGKIAELSQNDQAVVQAVTNLQADAEAGAVKNAKIAMSAKTGIPQPTEQASVQSTAPVVQYSAPEPPTGDGKIFGLDQKVVMLLAVAGIVFAMKHTPATA